MLKIQCSSRDPIRHVISAKLEVSKREGPGDTGGSSFEAMSRTWAQNPTDSCLPQGIFAAAQPFTNFPTMTDASTTSRLFDKVEHRTICHFSDGDLSNTRVPRHSHSPYQSKWLCACAGRMGRLDHGRLGTRGWIGSNHRSNDPRPGLYYQF